METFLLLRPPQAPSMRRKTGGEMPPVLLVNLKLEIQEHLVLVAWLVLVL